MERYTLSGSCLNNITSLFSVLFDLGTYMSVGNDLDYEIKLYDDELTVEVANATNKGVVGRGISVCRYAIMHQCFTNSIIQRSVAKCRPYVFNMTTNIVYDGCNSDRTSHNTNHSNPLSHLRHMCDVIPLCRDA